MECKIKRVRGKANDYTLTLSGMTRGAIMALRNGLDAHAKNSAVAADVLAFLDYGIRTSEDQELVRSVLDAPVLAGEPIIPTPSSVPPATSTKR